MIWRMLRIIAFMVRRLLGYAWLGVFNRSKRESYLIWAYISWAHFILKVFNVQLEVRGRECVPPAGNGPRVFLCNHQSQLDSPVLVAAIEEKVGFVAKKELGRVPLLAFWMREIGCVFIDRSDKAGAHKSLEKAASELGDGILTVFPEGTRSKTGSLLPIKSGGLRMAVAAGAQIIPVHIENSRNAFEARASGTRDIPVQIRFFPPINSRQENGEKITWQNVKTYLEECWASPPAPLHS